MIHKQSRVCPRALTLKQPPSATCLSPSTGLHAKIKMTSITKVTLLICGCGVDVGGLGFHLAIIGVGCFCCILYFSTLDVVVVVVVVVVVSFVPNICQWLSFD